jgi:hypothetical protein
MRYPRAVIKQGDLPRVRKFLSGNVGVSKCYSSGSTTLRPDVQLPSQRLVPPTAREREGAHRHARYCVLAGQTTSSVSHWYTSGVGRRNRLSSFRHERERERTRSFLGLRHVWSPSSSHAWQERYKNLSTLPPSRSLGTVSL